MVDWLIAGRLVVFGLVINMLAVDGLVVGMMVVLWDLVVLNLPINFVMTFRDSCMREKRVGFVIIVMFEHNIWVMNWSNSVVDRSDSMVHGSCVVYGSHCVVGRGDMDRINSVMDRSSSMVHGSRVVERSRVMSGSQVRSIVIVDGGMVCWQVMGWDIILHLSAKEDLGKSKAYGVTILVEVLVLPLGLSVHDLVVDVLAVHDQVVLDVEDEVPGIGECLGHLTEFVKVRADSGLTFLKLVSDIVDDVTEVFDRVQH